MIDIKTRYMTLMADLANEQEQHNKLKDEHDAMCYQVNILNDKYRALKENYDRLLSTVKELQT